MPQNIIQSHSIAFLEAEGGYLVATGGGIFERIVFQGDNQQNVTIYDGLDAGGEKIADFATGKIAADIEFNAIYKTGLFVVLANDLNCTITYYSTVEPPEL
jgi:hypothetical protein